MYPRITREGQKPRISRTPIFPKEWQNQFGLPVEEHKKLLQVNIFDGFTIFSVSNKKEKKLNAEVTLPPEKPQRVPAGGDLI